MASDERRDRLSKAMGAAYLAAQVRQLEQSVDSLQFSRDARLYDGKRNPAPPSSATRVRERRIVDVSALVHALPLLKRAVREDTYELVVPLQAISILDTLKNAPAHLRDLARDATRFLETQLNIARQIAASTSGVTAPGRVETKIRLRAQAAKEELPWEAVEKEFTLPDGFIILPPPSNAEAETDEEALELLPPTAREIGRSIRSTLQCALYFQATPSPSTAILVYNDPHTIVDSLIPPSMLSAPVHRSNGSAPAAVVDYAALARGNLLNYTAQFFPRLNIVAISEIEVVAARNWLKVEASAAAKKKGSLPGTKPGAPPSGSGGRAPSVSTREQGVRLQQGGSRGRAGSGTGGVLFVP